MFTVFLHPSCVLLLTEHVVELLTGLVVYLEVPAIHQCLYSAGRFWSIILLQVDFTFSEHALHQKQDENHPSANIIKRVFPCSEEVHISVACDAWNRLFLP